MANNQHSVKDRIRALEAEAARLRREELRDIVVNMRRKIKEYGISPDTLFGPDLSDLVKYRHPETGQTWNGVGRPPNWIKGKDKSLFRVS
ncbi:H-NS family nucleoid-associated regulatory protein [Achromobacter insolitus]|uniref:H-NS histone family protein n=1 Tax=Achromobacter insolitus TaxID=217204 RepID=UPI001749890D|nr:H-NS histone family protein [Achromobacter insolitus]